MTNKCEPVFKDIYEKIQKGDFEISDEELYYALTYYRRLLDAITGCEFVPPEYSLFLSDVNDNIELLEIITGYRSVGRKNNEEGKE